MLFLCYPKCTTCQKAKVWLDEQGIAYELRHIKEEHPTAEELRAWWQASGLPLKKFFNTSGLQYKALDLKSKLPEMTEEERAEAIRKLKLPAKRWKFAGFRGPGHGVPFYVPEMDEYFFVHHVRDGAEVFKSVHHEQASYRMHYMVVRRMYFVDGWPVFSPEPFAGESGEVVTLQEYINSEKLAVKISAEGQSVGILGRKSGNNAGGEMNWEWILLKYGDNSIAMSVCGVLPENLVFENALVFRCFDFENSAEIVAFAGITDEGEVVWGKWLEPQKE